MRGSRGSKYWCGGEQAKVTPLSSHLGTTLLLTYSMFSYSMTSFRKFRFGFGHNTTNFFIDTKTNFLSLIIVTITCEKNQNKIMIFFKNSMFKKILPLGFMMVRNGFSSSNPRSMIISDWVMNVSSFNTASGSMELSKINCRFIFLKYFNYTTAMHNADFGPPNMQRCTSH